jgi:hypothetical protein
MSMDQKLGVLAGDYWDKRNITGIYLPATFSHKAMESDGFPEHTLW